MIGILIRSVRSRRDQEYKGRKVRRTKSPSLSNLCFFIFFFGGVGGWVGGG